MSCQRSREIELLSFLEEPGAEQFAAFREHYPLCVDCAAEIRAWTELDLQLRGGRESHPTAEQLMRFEDSEPPLSADERSAIAAHLAGCRSCSDELAAVRAFEPGALAAAGAGWSAWLRDLLSGGGSALRRLVWHPVFAYALVLILLTPIAVDRWAGPGEPPASPLQPHSLAKKSRSRADAPMPAVPRPALAQAEAETPAAGVFELKALPSSEPAAALRELSIPERQSTSGRGLQDRSEERANLPELPAEPQGELARVQIPLSGLAAASGEVEVRIVEREGSRERRQRVVIAPGQRQVEIELPKAWLSPGYYGVEILALEGPDQLRRVYESGFSVR